MSASPCRTVLFADLRGSTSLFESLGNAEATAVVTQSVDLLGRIVGAHRGLVIKTLGDGLLAVFRDPGDGIRAADEMHDALDRVGLSGGLENRRVPHGVSLKLQVGLAHGEIVERAGDVFGDAVNVAARLIDHAGDNETLLTGSLLDGVDERVRKRLRSLDRMQLRGRAEPVSLYRLEADRPSGDTATTAFGDYSAPEAEPESIRLTWLDRTRTFASTSGPLILGRSPQATYVIDDGRVSRSHARIVWHGGTFQLTDLSYNGTYVRFDHDPEVIALRRGTCTLHASGLIGLGAPPNGAASPCLRFDVVKQAEARRNER